jgi:hypothetical protein
MWLAFLSVPTVNQHFQSTSRFCARFFPERFFFFNDVTIVLAAFATATSAIHQCASAIVSVWFSIPLKERGPIVAIFGRGAVKFVLLPVIGLSLISSSISGVYVSVFAFAAAPFAIVYALGSLTHFYWAAIDFQSIFSTRGGLVSEPLNVAPPQRRSGRQNSVQQEVQTANAMRNIETIEQRARRLLDTMPSPKKRFIEQNCPMCFDAMRSEDDGNEKNSSTNSCQGNSVSCVRNKSTNDSHSPLKAIYLPCGHGLHKSCCVEVVKLRLIDAQCPMCRTQLFWQSVERQLFL